MDSVVTCTFNNKSCMEYPDIKPAGIKHPHIKQIHDLLNNKKVEEDRLFAVEGLWAYEKIKRKNIRIKTFAFCPELIANASIKSMVDSLINIAENSYTISQRVCGRLSDRDGADGFYLVCELPVYGLGDIKLKENNLIVIMDGLEKPGNTGTIIRSVDGAGGDAAIVVNRRVRLTHPRLIKASMGSAFMLPVIETDIDKLACWLKNNGFKIILTDLKASKNYFEADYTGKVAIVAGNEIRGISEAWYEHDCERVIIPMLGGADSLNVGFATTMVVYEASLRQKGLVNR